MSCCPLVAASPGLAALLLAPSLDAPPVPVGGRRAAKRRGGVVVAAPVPEEELIDLTEGAAAEMLGAL